MIERRDALRFFVLGLSSVAFGRWIYRVYHPAQEQDSVRSRAPAAATAELLPPEIEPASPAALTPHVLPAPPRTQTPRIPQTPTPEMTRPSPVKGLHMPFNFLLGTETAVMERIQRLTELLHPNCWVIDFKNEAGKVLVPFEHHLKPNGVEYFENPRVVEAVLAWAKLNAIHIVARQVVMVDGVLGRSYANLRHPSGIVDTQKDGNPWLDPLRFQEIADYNATIAKTVAAWGIEEIQLDYIRRPYTESQIEFQNRVEPIVAIVSAINDAVQDTSLLTVDVFGDLGRSVYQGTMADMGIGQHVETLGLVADGICPMVYPNLRDEAITVDAYGVVYERTTGIQNRLDSVESTAFVNPWIQGYGDTMYVRDMQEQVRAALDAGAAGTFFWNPELTYPSGLYT